MPVYTNFHSTTFLQLESFRIGKDSDLNAIWFSFRAANALFLMRHIISCMFSYSCAFFHYDFAFEAFYLVMLSTDSWRVFYFQIFYHRNREMMSFTLDSFRGSFRLISRTTSVFSKGVNTTISTGRLYYSYIIHPSLPSIVSSNAKHVIHTAENLTK